MQCANCEFQNMPGNVRCIRCGASLTLGSADIAIAPPRASARAKRLRQWSPRFLRQVGSRLGRITRPAFADSADSPRTSELPTNCLLRSIVPGWAQAYLGRTTTGRQFFWSWLGLVLASAACYGSQIGAIFVGAMLSVHFGSMIDLFWRLQRYGGQVRRTIGTAAGCTLVLAMYWMIGSGLHRTIDTRQWIEMAAAPFAPGDVLVFRPTPAASAVHPGEVVLFRGQTWTGNAQVLGWHVLRRINGEWVDRVIAGPGSHVLWEKGELWVDGRPSDLRPLNPARMPERLEMDVPPGSLAIFPTTDPNYLPDAVTSAIARGRIIGRAIMRNYPPWRFWVIR
ncbi:MAG TPA: hypothetical protein VMF30_10145 [Pirellulales bacterium]|nr:hypothetical protein [Pirellulales bacterium]